MDIYKTLPAGLVAIGLALIGYNVMTPKKTSNPVKLAAKTSASHKPAAVTEQQHEPFFPDKLKVSNKNADKTSVLLNDPEIYKNWGLKVSDTLKARGITEGSKNVIVAIIDTGMDTTHLDLKNNTWVNPGESGLDKDGRDKATNGKDDDGNGFTDDVNGWNFVSNNNKVNDNHGHGTHIAGIIGAEGGNNYGISGIASKVSMMVLKYYDPKYPSSNLDNTIKAIDYAVKMKAHIINYSGGGVDFSQQEYEAIRRARSQGVLFVAAAGNERSNSDKQKYYPANYELDNIISVTAINPQLQVLSSSNYGVQTVHVAAPGEEIYSTMPGGTFGTLTGTSQATAFATGLAVLIKANNPEFNYAAIKTYILKTGDEYPWLRSKTGTSKKLNMYKALSSLDQGVGASGALAVNTSGMAENAFASDPQAALPTSQTSELVQFGKGLMKTMGSENVRTINNQQGQ